MGVSLCDFTHSSSFRCYPNYFLEGLNANWSKLLLYFIAPFHFYLLTYTYENNFFLTVCSSQISLAPPKKFLHIMKNYDLFYPLQFQNIVSNSDRLTIKRPCLKTLVLTYEKQLLWDNNILFSSSVYFTNGSRKSLDCEWQTAELLLIQGHVHRCRTW